MCPAQSRTGWRDPYAFQTWCESSIRFVVSGIKRVDCVDTVAPPEGCGWRLVVSNLFLCKRTRARLILGEVRHSETSQ